MQLCLSDPIAAAAREPHVIMTDVSRAARSRRPPGNLPASAPPLARSDSSDAPPPAGPVVILAVPAPATPSSSPVAGATPAAGSRRRPRAPPR